MSTRRSIIVETFSRTERTDIGEHTTCKSFIRRPSRATAVASRIETADDERAALVREAGADDVIVYSRSDVVGEVKRLTNGEGVDVVYDSVGKDTFDESIDCLGMRGMMVLCGSASGPVPPFDPQVLNRKGSLYLTRPLFAHYVADPAELTARVTDLLNWIAAGWLHVRIHRALPLTDAIEAHRILEAHRAVENRETGGKMVLVP